MKIILSSNSEVHLKIVKFIIDKIVNYLKNIKMGRKSDNQQSILNVASRIFWTNGYESTGVNEICANAGINKGTLYHFFQNKEEIALAVIENNFKLVDDFIKINDHLPNQEQINLYFDMVLENQKIEYKNSGKVPGCPFGDLGAEMASNNENIRIKINEWFRYMIAFLEKRITDNNRITTNNYKLAENLFTYWQGALLLAKTSNSLDPLIKAQRFTKNYLKDSSTFSTKWG